MKGITPTVHKLRISRTHRTGFTIVELLIVIVVIGILAAITIVAFNGVTGKARASVMTADLVNSNKQLQVTLATSSAYPATLSEANLKGSNGDTYQYSVDNSSNPPTFCLTVSNSNKSYFINQDTTTPVLGACPGHTNAAGPAITNLAVNPSMETNLTGWAYWPGTNATASASNPSTGGYSGQDFGRLTWSVGTTSISGGPSFSIAATAGTTYSPSFWVRPSKQQRAYMETKFLNSAGGTLTAPTSTPITIPAGVWTNIGTTQTAPSGVASLTVGIYASSGSGSQWNAGDYIDYDAAMVTTGSTLYSFADGNSSGWSWSGTANNSTSTGPGTPQ